MPRCATALFALKRRTQVLSPRTIETEKSEPICTSPAILHPHFKRITTLVGLSLLIGLAGCASKSRYVDPYEAEGDATLKFAPVFGAIGWTNSPTQTLQRDGVLAMMEKSCAESGLKANPLDEYQRNGTTLSRYECNP